MKHGSHVLIGKLGSTARTRSSPDDIRSRDSLKRAKAF